MPSVADSKCLSLQVLKGVGPREVSTREPQRALEGTTEDWGVLGFYALETPPFHNPITKQKDNTFDAGAFRLARATEQLRAEHDKTSLIGSIGHLRMGPS